MPKRVEDCTFNTSSMVFLVEHAPEQRRALMGALGASGAGLGTLLGSAVGAAYAASMSTAALDAWGWRIPFLLGLLVGIAGYILRRYVLETGVAEKRTRAPIIETLHDHGRLVVGFSSVSFHILARLAPSICPKPNYLMPTAARHFAPAGAPPAQPEVCKILDPKILPTSLNEPNHVLLVNDKHNYRRTDPNQELALLLCHDRFTAAGQGIMRQQRTTSR